MKKRVETKMTRLYRRIVRIPWTKYVNNENILKKMGIRNTLISNITKKQLKFCRRHNEEEGTEVFDTHRSLNTRGTEKTNS